MIPPPPQINDSCFPRPCVGITMGDPAGIGAEVVVKALADPDLRAEGRFIVYGLDRLLVRAAELADIRPFWFTAPPEKAGEISSGVLVANVADFLCVDLPRVPSKECGQASLLFLDHAIEAARQGRIQAIVTAPIHKTSWRLAGCRAPGHTERLAAAFGARDVTMLFAADDLRVALATTHIALMDIRNVLTIGCVYRAIDHLGAALRQWWGVEDPLMAIAGLNPHCGENDLFGDEETRIIGPAMDIARREGWRVEGPFPADTLFIEERRSRYHGIVAMYHDQGLIPVKMLAFDSAVNLTMGLPIVRTSVDHGTAFDIAWRNQANFGSMKEAIRLACQIAGRGLRRNPPSAGSGSLPWAASAPVPFPAGHE